MFIGCCEYSGTGLTAGNVHYVFNILTRSGSFTIGSHKQKRSFRHIILKKMGVDGDILRG